MALLAFQLFQTQVSWAADDPPGKVVVFAAASTAPALSQIAKEYESSAGVKIEIVPGPTSGLVRQIEQGADADLLLSADQANADRAQKNVDVARRRNLLTNRLVVIVPADSRMTLDRLADLNTPAVKRLALAEASVPAGKYAREALRTADLLDALAPRFVEGIDVRATLQYVARDEVDAGLVYASDAVGSTRIRVALEIDPGSHTPIEYPLLLLGHDPPRPAAAAFFDYLRAPDAAEVFRRHGFGLAEKSAQ